MGSLILGFPIIVKSHFKDHAFPAPQVLQSRINELRERPILPVLVIDSMFLGSLRVSGLGFRVLGFRVLGFGFRESAW